MSSRTIAVALLLLQGLAGAARADDAAPVPPVSFDASLTTMLQRAGHRAGADGLAQTRASYRGDIAVTLNDAGIGDSEGHLFAHLRFGRGAGLSLHPTYTSSVNTSAFELSPDGQSRSSFAILAQAWYQLCVPLADVGSPSKRSVEFTAGKIDPFVFFDQNAAADDETTRFANNVFVHNPLLDSGGDVGVDRYGFAPGVRIAYRNERDAAHGFGVSLGVFERRFAIAQADASLQIGDGLAGTYRLYAWHNPHATNLHGVAEMHRGWGVSADQCIGFATRLFGRYGRRSAGHGPFDEALTLGAEIGGDGWQRPADGLGFAHAWLPTGNAHRDSIASATERVTELYYRYRLDTHVDLSPDLQWIRRPAGDASAADIVVVGVRAKFTF